jgi:hypothetical protein
MSETLLNLSIFFMQTYNFSLKQGKKRKKNGRNIPDFTRLLQKIKKKLKKMQIFA